MLLHLLRYPKQFMQITRLYALNRNTSFVNSLISLSTLADTIIKIVYGVDVRDMNDHMVIYVENLLASIAAAGNPGTYLVDDFPICT